MNDQFLMICYLPRQRVLASGSAGIGAGEHGAAVEVAALLGNVHLEVLVKGVAGMVTDGVRDGAAPAGLDCRAVRAARPAHPVQTLQQRRVGRPRACHAPDPRGRYEVKDFV